MYNTAVGERTTLNELVSILKELLSKFDSKIADINVIYGDERVGDIPHSLASIDKAKSNLKYNPTHNLKEGLIEAIDWYWGNRNNQQNNDKNNKE